MVLVCCYLLWVGCIVWFFLVFVVFGWPVCLCWWVRCCTVGGGWLFDCLHLCLLHAGWFSMLFVLLAAWGG